MLCLKINEKIRILSLGIFLFRFSFCFTAHASWTLSFTSVMPPKNKRFRLNYSSDRGATTRTERAPQQMDIDDFCDDHASLPPSPPHHEDNSNDHEDDANDHEDWDVDYNDELADDNAAPVAIPSNLDMRVWDNWTNLHAEFPVFAHYSTLTRTVFPHIRKHCLPQLQYRKTLPEGGSIDYAVQYRQGKGRTNIPDQAFVSPSEWARYDLRDPSFFRSAFDNNFQSSIQKHREFENTPLVPLSPRDQRC